MTKSDKSGSPGDSQTKQILKKAEADDTESKKSAFLLRLYIAGATPQSTRAVGNIKKICEEHLNGSYQLEVIDLYQQPQLAAGEQIIAVPTLIKKLPLPLRVIIGDLSDTECVLAGLDLQ